MIDFEEELEKFKPSLEINRAEDVIHQSDMTDVSDIIKELLDEIKNKKNIVNKE